MKQFTTLPNSFQPRRKVDDKPLARAHWGYSLLGAAGVLGMIAIATRVGMSVIKDRNYWWVVPLVACMVALVLCLKQFRSLRARITPTGEIADASLSLGIVAFITLSIIFVSGMFTGEKQALDAVNSCLNEWRSADITDNAAYWDCFQNWRDK